MSDLPRRAAPGLALAGAALATVWLFEPALQSDPAPTATGSADVADPATDDPGGGAADAPSDAEGSPDPSDGEPDTGGADAAAGDCSSAADLTGDPVLTRWGPVQVRAEVAPDGTLCQVQAVAYPSDDRKSAQINAGAIPTLDSQAAELGVQFQAVSGATYTSEAYRDSLQSILDRL